MLTYKNLPVGKERGDRLSAVEVNQIVDAVRVMLTTDPRFKESLGVNPGISAEWVWANNVGEASIGLHRPAGITGQVFDGEKGIDKFANEVLLEIINPKESKANFEGHYVVAAENIAPGQNGRVWISGICPAWGLSRDTTLDESVTMASYTSGSEITVTLGSEHRVEVGDVVVMSWTEGGDPKTRLGVTASVSGDVATLTGGDGDNYPDDVGLSMSLTRENVEKTYCELFQEEDENGDPDFGKNYLTCATGGSTRVVWKREDSEFEQLMMIRLGFASVLIDPNALVPVKITSKINFNTYIGDEYGDGTDTGATLSDVTVRVLQIGADETIPNSTILPGWLQKWGGVLYRTIDVARDY